MWCHSSIIWCHFDVISTFIQLPFYHSWLISAIPVSFNHSYFILSLYHHSDVIPMSFLCHSVILMSLLHSYFILSLYHHPDVIPVSFDVHFNVLWPCSRHSVVILLSLTHSSNSNIIQSFLAHSATISSFWCHSSIIWSYSNHLSNTIPSSFNHSWLIPDIPISFNHSYFILALYPHSDLIPVRWFILAPRVLLPRPP